MSKALIELIKKNFGAAVLETHSLYGDDTVVVEAAAWKQVARFLRDTPQVSMDMLTDFTAVDFPEREPRFEIVAHFYSLSKGHRLRLKTRTGDSEAALDVREVAWELGLGRPRVLSLIGMDDAADRWVNGAGGPHVPLAEAAPGHCGTCGFVLRLGGLLGQAFGVCANESSPSDGHVVTYDHGCGAHSEAAVTLSLSATTAPVLDEVGYDQLGHG